ncbi:MAG TPA: cellulase family glycosylhydrolase [Microvirga sp.]|jgi:aryl-phospho-beta-D-glucosidase BglC (GH1 family)
MIGPLSTSGNQIVDATGKRVQIHGVNWSGLETQTFVPDGLHARNYKAMIDQMADLGFNTLRIPYSNAMMNPGQMPRWGSFDAGLNPDLVGKTSLEILDAIIVAAGARGLRVILDHHRNDANPGASENGLWYNYAYSEQRWIADWTALAARYKGNHTVIGADLHNEPHKNATWGGGGPTDWAAAAERAGNAVHAVNPNWLVFVEGVEAHNGQYYWWGGNLMGVRDRRVELNTPNKVVYSPHDYPNSIHPQPWFNDANFANSLTQKFDQMWGYIYRENIAPVYIGEMGSKFIDPKDALWFEKLRAYIGGDFDADGTRDIPAHHTGISWSWWALNPNSSDTGGILNDDWTTVDSTKYTRLDPMLPEGIPVPVLTPPVAASEGNVAFGQEDVPLSGQLPAGFDPDGDTPLSYELLQPIPGLLLDDDGGFFFIPPSNATGQLGFAYRVVDAHGMKSAPQVFSIFLAPVNDAPTASSSGNAALGREDALLTGQVPSAWDPDSPLLSYQLVEALPGLALQASGTFTYAPPANFNGSVSFRYRAVDETGAASQARTFTITVAPTNDAPSGIALSRASVAEHQRSGVIGAFSAADIDPGDRHSFRLLDDAGGRFAVKGGDLVVARGILLDYEQARSHVIRVAATDAAGAEISADFVIRLRDVRPERVTGTSANDVIHAGAGADRLNGAGGHDRLLGGAGPDTLTGGSGRDSFVFRKGDSGPALGQADLVTDFSGARGDRIDLRAIDAHASRKGDQAFSFIGTDPFTKAGQVRYETTDTETVISYSTDGDTAAEGAIRLLGAMDLRKGWFVL